MSDAVNKDGGAPKNMPKPTEPSAPTASTSTAGASTASTASTAKPSKPPNPVFRMMGIPNLPKKLPSRNWMIFWTVLASFTAAKMYDTRQKKAVQQKWCDLVAHVSQQRTPVKEMPRKLTVFLSAMPGDGIGPSRQYFKDYVKPVLVAASMDYEVIEGRKEGDVRYGTAEHIRRQRRRKGEKGHEEPEVDAAMAIESMRANMGLESEPGVRGDLVLGRHTWKEYIRGIHEGWLGPLDEPPEANPETSPIHSLIETQSDPPAVTTDSEGAEQNSTNTDKPAEEQKEEEKKTKPYPPPAYISISEYASAPLSQHTPSVLEPSEPIHQQHLLGFLKTPQRVWNWLNRRSLQDQIGRQTAAIVLASYRPYKSSEEFALPDADVPLATRAPENDSADTNPVQTSEQYEQQSILDHEEYYWHKSVRKPLADTTKERVLLNDIVLDSRIASRMRRFELDPEQEDRANRILAGDEDAKWATPVQDLRKQKPLLSDSDEDSMS